MGAGGVAVRYLILHRGASESTRRKWRRVTKRLPGIPSRTLSHARTARARTILALDDGASGTDARRRASGRPERRSDGGDSLAFPDLSVAATDTRMESTRIPGVRDKRTRTSSTEAGRQPIGLSERRMRLRDISSLSSQRVLVRADSSVAAKALGVHLPLQVRDRRLNGDSTTDLLAEPCDRRLRDLSGRPRVAHPRDPGALAEVRCKRRSRFQGCPRSVDRRALPASWRGSSPTPCPASPSRVRMSIRFFRS